VSALSSRHLPIRLMAATILPSLCHLPPVAQAVSSVLGSVIQRIVSISSQIDSDEVMTSLQGFGVCCVSFTELNCLFAALVAKFPTQMAPLALQLIPPVIKGISSHLFYFILFHGCFSAFNRAIRDEENSEAASLAAFGALDLIVSVVDECAEHTKDQQVFFFFLFCLFF
jgi:hypothetical protein